ncbi:HAD family phosphatase [Sporosarcina sp. ANT_H38]|uniref:HAD-IIB family hydrolase n=1 Tax=Sporosarcina sp. ANT_H38 TaxID=2597358 RepID=UPI0011F3B9A2|nr:HAD family hydrolase [Sporosarcina sp. ANT_H38]KAA0944238.1 HAD family phosphatase [Sporosarcina sp. ANT_H38]
MNFIFDIDGTICFKGKPISEKILNSLESLKANGHNVIFASARPIRDMLPVIDHKFHSYTMIGGNGSLISVDGNILYSNSFTDVQRNSISNILDEYNATYLIDGEWDYTYTGPLDHPILNNLDPLKLAKNINTLQHKSIVKILILTSDDMDRMTDSILKLDVVIHKHGNENVIDISPKGIHKWSALNKLGIEKGDYVAYGNDANDISMFMNAAYSIMVGDHKELSKHASESIPLSNNTEDDIIKKINLLSTINSVTI